MGVELGQLMALAVIPYCHGFLAETPNFFASLHRQTHHNAVHPMAFKITGYSSRVRKRRKPHVNVEKPRPQMKLPPPRSYPAPPAIAAASAAVDPLRDPWCCAGNDITPPDRGVLAAEMGESKKPSLPLHEAGPYQALKSRARL